VDNVQGLQDVRGPKFLTCAYLVPTASTAHSSEIEYQKVRKEIFSSSTGFDGWGGESLQIKFIQGSWSIRWCHW